MKKQFILLSCLIILSQLSFAQNSPLFYEHYTGLISQDLKITADLINLKNSFSGFYYYQFKEEGAWKTSKPIALDGRVGEEQAFVLNEFGENHSFFQGRLENSKLIRGQWHNADLKEAVDFTLKATYPQGSIPMNLVESDERRYFDDDPTLPQAHIHISVLFPTSTMDQAVYHQLLKRIDHLIGFRGELKQGQDIITSLEERFFHQFQLSLANIKVDSLPSSFNWEKSIRMDVINNEGALLCLQVETYAKTGLRDGARVKKYLVFDEKQNKVIKLNDLLIADKKDQLENLLQEKIRNIYHIDETTPLTQAGFFNDSIAPTQNFYLHPGGLGFYYNVYEIAPAANGPSDLFIPWQQLHGLINIP